MKNFLLQTADFAVGLGLSDRLSHVVNLCTLCMPKKIPSRLLPDRPFALTAFAGFAAKHEQTVTKDPVPSHALLRNDYRCSQPSSSGRRRARVYLRLVYSGCHDCRIEASLGASNLYEGQLHFMRAGYLIKAQNLKLVGHP